MVKVRLYAKKKGMTINFKKENSVLSMLLAIVKELFHLLSN